MQTRADLKWHLLGLAVGRGIGALFLLPTGPDPNTGSTASSFGAATFAGGAVGGCLLGPSAWHARGHRAWAATIAGIAGVAVLVGDAVVVAGLSWRAARWAMPGLGWQRNSKTSPRSPAAA
jgi:hypothetical protein